MHQVCATPRLVARFDPADLLAELAAYRSRPISKGHPGWSVAPLKGDEHGRPGPYRTTAFRHVLESLNAASARLSVLGPGGRIQAHRDKERPNRIHVPIVTSPQAVLTLDGVDYSWPAGEAWQADFSVIHSVRNDGPERIILLITV